MTTVCFFNNKGGVGKTTLACNVAASMADHFNLAVLLVDADPQCNATQLMLNDKMLEPLYGTARPKKLSPPCTLFDLLQPIAKGDSEIAQDVRPIKGQKTRFNVDLIAGHPRVALLEDRLSQAWIDFGSGIIGGARRTNWVTSLSNRYVNEYDVIVVDVGPSLGALNRSVLVGSDYFVAPMGCDIFSIMGVANISEWLTNWLRAYDRGLDSCRDQWGNEISEYDIRDFKEFPLLFGGYTVQQYVTKSIKGDRRPTRAYEKIIQRFPAVIKRQMSPFLGDISVSSLKLGDVPNMYSLVPLAQDANAPIHGILSKDGLVGAHYSQQKIYAGFIKNVAREVLANIGFELDDE